MDAMQVEAFLVKIRAFAILKEHVNVGWDTVVNHVPNVVFFLNLKYERYMLTKFFR